MSTGCLQLKHWVPKLVFSKKRTVRNAAAEAVRLPADKVRFLVHLRYPAERKSGQEVLDKVKESVADLTKVARPFHLDDIRLTDIRGHPMPLVVHQGAWVSCCTGLSFTLALLGCR